MDPRVKTSAVGLQKKFQVETRLASIMTETSQALRQGGSIRSQLEKLSALSTKESVEAFQKKLTDLLGAPGGFLAPPSEEVTLNRVNGQADTVYAQVWQADAEPTAPQMAVLAATESDSADVLKRWNEFKNTDLPALNRKLRESKVPEVKLEADLHPEESQVDEE
jgi:hypothetical protein